MSVLLAILGSIVLVAVVVDVFATVVRPDGSGFIASAVSRAVWRTGLAVHRRHGAHGFLATSGVAAVVLMPLTWMFLMWAGWTAVFFGSPDAVVDGRTGRPSDGWSRAYFAGFSLFTSGLGDHVPGGAPWQMATVLATAMGLGLVTLAVTFLVPVVQAANDRRAVARTIYHLGRSAHEIVRTHEATGFRTLAMSISGLPAALTKLAIQHHSYPVLDHLHSPDVRQALMPRIATLHGACVIAAAEADDLERVHLEAMLQAIDFFTCSLAGDTDDGATAIGEWSSSRARTLSDAERVRTRLRRLVEADGWAWDVDVLDPATPDGA